MADQAGSTGSGHDGESESPDDGGGSSRERILDAALLLFSRQGYEETSVAEVARRADVSKGLVYHYFDTKEDVLRAVMGRGADRLEATLGRGGEDGPPDPPAAMVMNVLALVAGDLRWWRLFFRLRTQPELGRELGLMSWGASVERHLERSLRSAGASDPESEARALAAAVEGAAQRYVLSPDTYPLVQVADAIVRGRPEAG